MRTKDGRKTKAWNKPSNEPNKPSDKERKPCCWTSPKQNVRPAGHCSKPSCSASIDCEAELQSSSPIEPTSPRPLEPTACA
eukprot:jgi/Pico_ML_1/53059/g3675.t1